MTEHKNTGKFPETAQGSLGYQVAKVTLGAADIVIPGLGYTLQYFADRIVGDPLHKRQAEWLGDLAERLAAMNERLSDFDPERLAENDEFLSVVAFSVDAVRRTHRQEKRDALRNAALNTATGLKLTDIMLGTFLSCIERYSPTHIAIMKLLSDPTANDDFRRYGESVYLAGSIERGVQRAIPELTEEELETIVRELGADGFADVPLRTMMSSDGVLAKRTTSKGDAFLKFISEPT